MSPKIEQLLSELSTEERAELRSRLLSESARIRSTPGVCGGAVCIRSTRIPVWVLESYRRAGSTDEEILEIYPVLDGGDLAAAWRYVGLNIDEIETEISENKTLPDQEAALM